MKTKKLLFRSLFLIVALGTAWNLNAADYFVKVEGNGSSGLSWDDALSGSAFVEKVKANGFVTGDVINFAGGTYVFSTSPTDLLEISVGLTLVGGFNPASTGNNTSINYPSATETIFSGDLNGDGLANEGDAYWILAIKSPDKVTMKGITFEKACYTGQVDEEPGAIYVTDTKLDLQYCKILDNKSLHYGGGGGLTIISSIVNCYQCLIKGNSAPTRGGAVRIMSLNSGAPGALILDECLVTGNSTTSNYGGAIQISRNSDGVSTVFVINSTITDNFCGEKGGGAVSVSRGQALFILSSTLANNPSVDKSQGSSIRLDTKSGAYCYMLNSICVDSDTEKTIGLNAGGLLSGGGNFVGGTDSDAWGETDIVGKVISDAFGSNILADNGGFTQTIKPVIEGTISVAGMLDTGNRWLTSNEISGDLTKDQRGYSRSDATLSIGAYDFNASSSLYSNRLKSLTNVFPTRTSGIVMVSDSNGKTIRVINTQGALVKTITCQSNSEAIDLSSLPKGLYFFNIDTETVKVMLQ